MKCLVCDSKMIYYFRKSFEKFELNDVEYWKCTNCGFVSSKTHYEMSEEKFASLNISYHQAYQSMDFNPDDPRWLVRLNAQAEMIDDAATIGLIKEDGKWIDYACGGGQLSALLGAKFDRSLLSYDKYMERRPGFLDHRDLIQQHFDFVISTSVFEHFRKREHYDSVQSLVRSGGGGGVLGLHTVICETIPQDPEWFYLLPVHCSFLTNKSASLLFEQWGYKASIYNVGASLWLWFTEDFENVQELVEKANKRSNHSKYILKNGFVDYWK